LPLLKAVKLALKFINGKIVQRRAPAVRSCGFGSARARTRPGRRYGHGTRAARNI